MMVSRWARKTEAAKSPLQLLRTAKDDSIEFPHFTKKNLHGLKRILYLGYYERVEKILGEGLKENNALK